MQEETPLEKARQLILSLSIPQEAQPDIDLIEPLPSAAREMRLLNLYYTAPDLATKGETKRLSVLLRVFDYFSDHSHDEKLLSYIAQAEANSGLVPEEKNNYDHGIVRDAIKIITDAMAATKVTPQATDIQKGFGLSMIIYTIVVMLIAGVIGWYVLTQQ
jgi:hypothetical protein